MITTWEWILVITSLLLFGAACRQFQKTIERILYAKEIFGEAKANWIEPKENRPANQWIVHVAETQCNELSTAGCVQRSVPSN